MANIAGSYNPDAEVNEQLPAGEYLAEIVESEIVPVSMKNDVGDCLKMTWRVIEGPQTGRLAWQRLNLYFRGNNSAKVVEIANSQFAEVRKATGKHMPDDSSELHHIPCRIIVGPQKNSPEYLEFKKVHAAGSAPATGAGQPAAQSGSPAQGQAPAGPWRQGAAA